MPAARCAETCAHRGGEIPRSLGTSRGEILGQQTEKNDVFYGFQWCFLGFQWDCIMGL
jgi:hypothetical protein